MKRSFFAIAVSLWTFFYVVALHAAAPSIPAHARFQDSQTYRQKHAGQLLVEELNCVSCHTSELPLNAKQAPILTEVMTRAKAAHLLKFIQTPHETKPGTSMPNVQVSAEQADALLHFLGSLSAAEPPQEYANFGGQRRGEKLFHSVGCVACHDPVGKDLQTSVPLGDLPAKYTLASLAQFLKNPLHARPSGRMPSMNLSMREAKDIAAFLLPDTPEKAGIEYEYYELDSPQRLPDFDALTPVASGGTERFDVRKHSKRADNFGLRYSGILQVEQEGEYRFMLGSDDGSKLIIDDKVMINNDGEHGMVRKNARITLSPGRHAVQVEYFEKGGGEELVVTFRPPGGKSGPLDVELVASAPAQPLEDLRFTVDPQKAQRGKGFFASLGCAACHDAGQKITNQRPGPALKDLRNDRGCLGSDAAVDFRLAPSQKTAVQAFLSAVSSGKQPTWTDEERIQHTTLQFNCLACHQRGELGGVEESRREYFQTTQMEMGIEGSIPPHLNGIGDKLTTPWLEQILTEGAKDRPYMLTKMPKFGKENIGHLAAAFATVDRQEALADVPLDKNAKKIGHRLVGAKGFSCIKCHTFGRHKATGVQSIDMTIMTKRLRKDWFRRYVRDPQAYRPGTRMPSAWPTKGKSYLPDLLDGDSDRQIAAVWRYLEGGTSALTPSGLTTGSKELIPIDEVLIYRNFIQGAGSRAIGVGSPEGLHFAFDANELRLALLWKGAFMNAARHWTGRGQGYEPPAGDQVKATVTGLPLATLASADASWPARNAAAENGDRFLGYRLLGEYRSPELMYQVNGLRLSDLIVPKPSPTITSLSRTLKISGDVPENTYFRIAVGSVSAHDSIANRFEVADGLAVQLAPDTTFLLRESNGVAELLLPLSSSESTQTLQFEYIW